MQTVKVTREPNFSPVEKMKIGADKLADAVKKTLGAGGQNVIIEQEGGFPIITKDGVTVAEHVVLEDKIENLGAQILKQAAQQTARISGDSTSSTTAFAQALINNGLEAIKNKENVNQVEFTRGIEAASKIMAELIEKEAIQVTDSDYEKIATVSANGDVEMGKLVAEAVRVSGLDGTITAERSLKPQSYVERTNGMSVTAPIFNTGLFNKGNVAAAEDVLVLVSSKKMMRQAELVPILRYVIDNRKSLLIINEYIEGEAMHCITENAKQMQAHYGGTIICSRSGMLGHGMLRDQVLEDICAFTGATFIRDESGISLEQVTGEHFGYLEKVVVDARKTVMTNPEDTEDQIKARVAVIREQMKINDGLEEFHKKRISALLQGLATIHISFMTDIEGNEKAFRIDDAIKACKSAIEKGYVAGGGVALPQIAHKNSGKIVEEYEKLSSRDMKDGYQSFFKSLTAPLSCILSNAGIEEDINKIVEGEFGYGINVVSRERVNMIEEGIIDPAKAMMCVVENGASVACLFLTTSCAMVANEAK